MVTCWCSLSTMARCRVRAVCVRVLSLGQKFGGFSRYGPFGYSAGPLEAWAASQVTPTAGPR